MLIVVQKILGNNFIGFLSGIKPNWDRQHSFFHFYFSANNLNQPLDKN